MFGNIQFGLITGKALGGGYLKSEANDYEHSAGYLIMYTDEEAMTKKAHCRPQEKINPIEIKYYVSERCSDMTVGNYEAGRWKKMLNQYYSATGNGVSKLGGESKGQKYVIKKLSDLFNHKSRDASILIYFGAANNEGAWMVPVGKSFEKIKPDEILDAWQNRKSKQKFLLIILDHNSSGKWVTKLNTRFKGDRTIAIQAATTGGQKAKRSKCGGFFSHNLFKLYYMDGTSLHTFDDQEPSFSGSVLYTKKYTNFYLSYNGWKTMDNLSKGSYKWTEAEKGNFWGLFAQGARNYWGNLEMKEAGKKKKVYKGEFKQGRIEGEGIMDYGDGKTIEGNFLNGKPHGFAIEQFKSGRYEGNYAEGLKHGKGIYYYNNGDEYNGQWKNDYPNGNGVLKLANGSVYEGKFKNGMSYGKGKITYYNGDIYEGDWVNDLKHGEGVYSFKNGDVYTGFYVKGKREGEGVIEYKNGSKYKGGWKNDQKHGEGMFWDKDGTMLNGEWKGDAIKQDINFYKKHGANPIKF